VTGALQTAVAAQVAFQTAFGHYIPVSGELTDELTDLRQYTNFDVTGEPVAGSNATVQVDARQLDQSLVWEWNGSFFLTTNTVYAELQSARGLTLQAIGGLATYAPDSLHAVRGQLYALLGYTEIMLADLFCSGVPLSTLDFQGDYTYRPGSTTNAIYQHAIVLFDTALTLAVDSPAVLNLAHVGQGRAYLGMGKYPEAAQAVETVPPTFQYTQSLLTCGVGHQCPSGLSGTTTKMAEFNLPNYASVSNREGGTGLPFVSSGDPRTAETVARSYVSGYPTPQYFPQKYQYNDVSTIVLASGLEAQLIMAEAALNANHAADAFTILNSLRASIGMPALTDPGTFGAELDTLFTERAAWLFVDGHRQGDLRRLQRNYVNSQGIAVVANQYPSGPYPGYGLYGTSIDAPIPADELANPHWTGCLGRD
jgi:hypothetical protein